MTGIIDVGGGLRDIYGAGIGDWCIRHGVHFDRAYGVSAGCANIAALQARQDGRNYVYYHDYAFRPEYMSLRNFLRTGSYIDLDYIYRTLSNEGGEYPLDYDVMASDPAPFTLVATDARTGGAVYLDKGKDLSRNDYGAICASCCVPVINRPYVFRGTLYLDGGLSDPVPVARALEDGCDRIVLILTRPAGTVRSARGDIRAARLFLRRKYPAAAAALERRAEAYNRAVALAKRLEGEGRALVLAPETIGRMNMLTKSREDLEMLYSAGLRDAERIDAFLDRGGARDAAGGE